MHMLKVDQIEITFEKQHDGVSCNWCVYVKVGKNKHEKIMLMAMCDQQPFVNFTNCKKDMTIYSKMVAKTMLSSINTKPKLFAPAATNGKNN